MQLNAQKQGTLIIILLPLEGLVRVPEQRVKRKEGRGGEERREEDFTFPCWTVAVDSNAQGSGF
jgi:hypothetical protein